MRHGKFPKVQPLNIVIDDFGPNDGRVRSRWVDAPDEYNDEELQYYVEVRVTDRMIKPSFGIESGSAYTVEEIERVINILSSAIDRAIVLRKPDPETPMLRLVGSKSPTQSPLDSLVQ
jgi:hypothetical protein